MRLDEIVSSESVIVDWRSTAKSAVRSMVVVDVLEAVDHVVERGERLRRVINAVELVPPSAIAPFDGTVELGSFRRKLVESDTFGNVCVLELGLKLGAAIDLDGFPGEGHVSDHLLEEARYSPLLGSLLRGLCRTESRRKRLKRGTLKQALRSLTSLFKIRLALPATMYRTIPANPNALESMDQRNNTTSGN
jgi:hypothetical protein